MGLDWVLWSRKPKPGYEQQFFQVMDTVGSTVEDLDQVSVSCLEELNAPQIGIDEVATDFLKKEQGLWRHRIEHSPNEISEAERQFWSRPLEDCVRDLHGQYVIELAKNSDGVPIGTGPMASKLDFRGAFLAVTDLSPELLAEGYEDHNPEEALAYAQRLSEAYSNLPSRKENRWVKDAVKWLTFWGSRGYGFCAWY